ncbi:BREX-1 system adenine-specific DNA-methyltransferase PglX [Psychrobacter sp. DAB_AL32B]|uniref:BREX-1 system adenine-specific DNA-methyltransferase PglX n=1 Tax=Psychrobacter sp. DAB_AL32B TaxID=1028414 RepID=UPI000B7C8906|nr:BREX-1 system adenine-specific DNA-methyltransferase PglX [Psychrobacter sp. DAB_AL32B]OXL24652.1 SAM-dependent methyltransferase [Psychrobacter sp. DAB_AL32B]
MNTSNIKKYAPKARIEFMDAVTKRLNSFGISQTKGTASNAGELRIAEAVVQGSVLQIDGNSFDSALAEPRRRLVVRSEQLGFAQLVEQEAYTWFNRLCAIRYMEIHDYLGHGFRVLSHPDNPTGFEIIDHAVDAADELDLDRDYIVELKLAGNKDEVLYRELLLKQCHKLHQAMPFLFEALNDASELLLPDNLTRTDSILRGLVDGIPEEDWQQVEVIGWLYQFYISEKKDEVMGKVVKSEDIPAATQLFTPNWIVKYLVQNSVGRQWLQTYPESPIKSQMEYYIEPAEQSAEVNEKLQAITPDSIEPESIKVLDPAVGSGHILIEAYNVLKAIYEERGYRPREIPKLILENNLYGLDIDDRAAQLSGFALMMMARDDDKRIFTRNVRLNVLALQEGNHINLPAQWRALNLSGGWDTGAAQDMFADDAHDLSSFEADNRYQLLQHTLARFTQAKTFGSLIDVPAGEYDGLKEMHETLSELAESGDSFQRPAAKQLIDIVHQALILSIRYDAVIANPPYMGSNGMNVTLDSFAKKGYPNSKSDLFAMFIERGFNLIKVNGYNSMVTMQSWMFLSSYEKMRKRILNKKNIETMVHMGNGVMKIAFGTNAAIFRNICIDGYIGSFSYVENNDINKQGVPVEFPVKNARLKNVALENFKQVPGSPIAYWASEKLLNTFINSEKIGDLISTSQGMKTLNNERFVKDWSEIEIDKMALDSIFNLSPKWYPINHGGSFRKWYGNNESVINWENDGQEIKSLAEERYDSVTRTVTGMKHYFKPGITWSAISSGKLSVRMFPKGSLFTNAGMCGFGSEDNLNLIAAFLNSKVARVLLEFISPTLNYGPNQIKLLPIKDCENITDFINENFEVILKISKEDWDSVESSWDFKHHPLVCTIDKTKNIKAVILLENYIYKVRELVNKARLIEEENNKVFISAYDLEEELDATVDTKDVSLLSNPFYVYGTKNVENLERSALLVSFISYFIGCYMGRYSLDRNGIVYAHSNDKLFDELVAEGAYKSFPADHNAIVPLTDQEWFKDDATDRFREFVQVVWGSEHLQENLDFIAESLCLHAIKPKKSESALDTIRRYLSTQFYKDHLKTYKKRPIYWLFSSGKHKAFECLVYLHRYNEGTLSRMRTEYVTPLLGKYDAYAEQLEKQVETAESTSDSNRFKKELATLAKQQVELREFNDKLKHYADMRISLDLDDGVKVNYGKFGDLLADVKAITGSAPEMK